MLTIGTRGLSVRPFHLLPLALPLLAAPAGADGVTVVLHGSHVERVSAGSTQIDAVDLAAGHSLGAVEFQSNGAHAIGAADGRNLGTYFARNQGVGPNWNVDLLGWSDSNGSGYDFFLFEVGGNDVVRVAPRFPDGSFGQEVTLEGWTSTGYKPASGPNSGQTAHGLAFKSRQLKDASGQFLADGTPLVALRLRSTTVDGAAFLMHRPDPGAGFDGDGSVAVRGALRAGQLVELTYQGPWASETDLNPNPFLDYRLNVTFVDPAGTPTVVPGFFEADDAGGDAGTVWRVRFRPAERGTWQAHASFREGPGVAVSLDPDAGVPGMLDGVLTSFSVDDFDPSAPGFLRYGMLRYVDGHYPRFERGPHFVKAGTNSPENLLAYRGFDGVAKHSLGGGVLHDYSPHVVDWREGDPYFVGHDHAVDSKGIIGALNYLSGQGINAVHAMLMNLGGDSQDVHPFLSLDDTDFAKTHYDTSRLAQWQAVFEHAARHGIALQLTLAETESENEQWLDGGQLGLQRKLFFRELVARFASHPAILWTLSEENDYPVPTLRDFADRLRALDPYDHPVGFHNHPQDFSDFNQVLGEQRFSAASLQFDPDLASDQVEFLRAASLAAGHPWAVGAVEHTPYSEGVTDKNHDEMRKRILYDVLFSGGHVEWYAGWHDLPLGGDLSLEDFRTREEMWEDTRHALDVLYGLPFWRMSPDDDLLSGESSAHGGGEVLASTDEAYAIYLPSASGSPVLDLSAATGAFQLSWFDPREGEFVGAKVSVAGGGMLALGSPPHSPGEDWVVIVERPDTLTADVSSISVSSGGEQVLTFAAGTAAAGRPYLLMGSMSGTSPGFFIGGLPVPLNFDRYTRWTIDAANGRILVDTAGFVPVGGVARMRVVLARGNFAGLVGTTLHHAVVLRNPTDFASNAVGLTLVQ